MVQNNFDTPDYWSVKTETDENSSSVFNTLKSVIASEFIEASGLGIPLKIESHDLKSCENRVFTVSFINSDRQQQDAVLKLYRPGQWSEESLREEHVFMERLALASVNIIAPLRDKSGNSLWKHNDIFFTIFPFIHGESKDITDEFPNNEHTIQLGRTIAQIHEVAAELTITARPTLKPGTYGRGNLEFLKRNQILPVEYHAELTDILEETIILSQPGFTSCPIHPIHADLYEGNILWNKGIAFIIDFDDMMIGPAVQDIRMLFRGRDEQTQHRIQLLLQGYREVRFFDDEWLKLIEPMRILRAIWYLAWVASRQHDRRFSDIMPGFGEEKFWQEEMKYFREQLQRVKEIIF